MKNTIDCLIVKCHGLLFVGSGLEQEAPGTHAQGSVDKLVLLLTVGLQHAPKGS